VEDYFHVAALSSVISRDSWAAREYRVEANTERLPGLSPSIRCTGPQCIEDIIGQAVLGYRAASFSVTRASLWALDVLIDLGFRYDSSIFPIRHDRYGLPGAAPEPNRLSAPSGRKLVEFPMSVARFLGVQVPVSGGGYFRILPYWLTRAGLKQIERRGRPATFYLHPLGGGSRAAAHPGGRVLALPPLHESRALREPAAAPAGGFPLHLDA
jgi:hypothetical protein